jgi:hypothetical protein
MLKPISLTRLLMCWSGSPLRAFADDWLAWARPEQLAPSGDWRTWAFIGGRGAGKTRSGSEWIGRLARSGVAQRIALIGPTFHDVREYFGHQPHDGSHDVFFHLDPLWSDLNISVVGVDWYPPLTDWRDGNVHLDAALARDIHDSAYLESRIEAGEDYAFYYASEADRSAQTRTAITDGAYSEPWIFRAKDARNFWGRQHFNRPGGVRAGSPTPWAAQSKPL